MLLHKDTMGVLDRIWTGRHYRLADGTVIPLDRPATLADVDNPAEWWEVPSAGPLARRIRMYYPWIAPELGPDGRLVGVSPTREPEQAPETDAALGQEAAQRGYQRRGKVRPRGLMPCLRVPKDAPNEGCTGRIEGLEPLKRKGRYL